MHRYLLRLVIISCIFFFNDPSPTEIYTLSLHDALPIWRSRRRAVARTRRRATSRTSWLARRTSPGAHAARASSARSERSEEHTSELQSHSDLVCRLLLEKKKKRRQKTPTSQEIYQTTNA